MIHWILLTKPHLHRLSCLLTNLFIPLYSASQVWDVFSYFILSHLACGSFLSALGVCLKRSVFFRFYSKFSHVGFSDCDLRLSELLDYVLKFVLFEDR